MASVTIGGRSLDVWNRQTPGSLGKMKAVAHAEAALAAAKGAANFDAIADLVACYVGHNEGVTVEWLLTVLPLDCMETLSACIRASGSEVAAGEAKSP